MKSHPVILTDIRNGRILVVDLDKQDPLAEPIWEWYPKSEQGWKYTTKESLVNALSDVRLRWSAYHKTQVVLFTGARGSVGMIEYPSGRCLWEAMVGISPHAIELLPWGDIVVVASGGSDGKAGRLHYLERMEDGTYVERSEHMLYAAHGVTWDENEQIVWASGFDDVVAFAPQTDKQGHRTMTLIEGRGTQIPCSYGHDLVQDLGDPDILWVSPSGKVFQFAKSKNKLLTEYRASEIIHPLLRAKGIASFPDGVVAWVAYGHHTSSEHPNHFSSLWCREDGTFETRTYTDESAGWNKVRIFSDRYM